MGPRLFSTIMSLQPFVSLYQYALTPLAPFSWFGLKTSSLDLVAAFRLCYVLRHLRENLRDEHAKRRATDSKLTPPEDRSFARDALTVLTVVYGGEAIAGTPSSQSTLHPRALILTSPAPRRPLLLHDLGRRPTVVHPRSSGRRHAPCVAADAAPLGTPAVLCGRAHPRDARVHPRAAGRTPQSGV